jgi:hypothetical protein
MNKVFGLVLVVLVTVLTACGGGGGGGGSSLSYEGLTTHAVISDEQTAADLSEQAFYGSDLDDALPIYSLQGSGSSSAVPLPVIQELAGLAFEFPNRVVIPDTAQVMTASSTATEGCYNSGGTVSFSGTETETHIDAKASFSNCDPLGDGTIFNGKFSIEATLDNLGNPSDYSISVGLFSIEWPYQNKKIILDGTMNGSSVDGTDSLTMNLVLSDTSSGQMIKLENYQLTLKDMSNHYAMSISGKIFGSEHGYFVLSTKQEILLNYYSEEPYEGVFRIAGGEGTWAEYDFSTAQGTFGDANGQLGTFNLTSD